MDREPACDVSVIIPFADDEENVGTLASRIAVHLRALHLRFEILAVDEDSRDNSVALLNLLRFTVPELKVLYGQAGFAEGVRVARGRTLWLVDATLPETALAPFSRAPNVLLDCVAASSRSKK